MDKDTANYDLVLRNCTVVDPVNSDRPESGITIGIKNGVIEFVGKVEESKILSSMTQVIDVNGKYVLPGLINAHTHLFQTLLRGLGDELPGSSWFKTMMLPAAGSLTVEDCKIAASIGAAESLLGGVTTVLDFMQVHSNPNFAEAVIDGMRSIGVRAIYGRGIVTYDGAGIPEHLIEPVDFALEHCHHLIQKFKDNHLVQIWAAPYAVWAITEESARKIVNWLETVPIRITLHVSDSIAQIQNARERFGMTDLEWFASIGLLNSRSLAVHAVQLDTKDIELLARTGSSVVHCPVANLYGGSGIAQVPLMRKAGIKIALGTDGAASNNTQNMLETIKLASLIHKGVNHQADVITAAEVFEMATSEGAEALGLHAKVGRIAQSYRADLIVFNPTLIHTTPSHHPVSDIVYAGMPSNIELVLVDGHIVVKDGRLLTVDLDELIQEGNARAIALLERAGIQHHRFRSRRRDRSYKA